MRRPINSSRKSTTKNYSAMAYTIKITTKANTDAGPTFKLKRDKRITLHHDIESLVNQYQIKRILLANFGPQMLNAYVKLKDNKGWQLICDMKLI